MSLSINTNISSLNAQRNLSKSQNSLKNSMERLSSGLRINSAKDDAAGLAITDRMTAQIRGLNQAARNANDGISLAQTAEGAMQESVNILQRIRELAVQSSNDTNTESDRNSLQSEVNQLVLELGRIGSTTQFNGLNLLDGTFSNRAFQVGANSSQTVTVSIDSVMAKDLSFNGTVIDAPNGIHVWGTTVSGASLNTGDLTVNGFSVSGTTDGSASSIADAINIANDKVLATAKNVQKFSFNSFILDATVTQVGVPDPSGVTPGLQATGDSIDIFINDSEAASVSSWDIAINGVQIDYTGIDFQSVNNGNDLASVLDFTPGLNASYVSGVLKLTATNTSDTLSFTSLNGLLNSSIAPSELEQNYATKANCEIPVDNGNLLIVSIGEGSDQNNLRIEFAANPSVQPGGEVWVIMDTWITVLMPTITDLNSLSTDRIMELIGQDPVASSLVYTLGGGSGPTNLGNSTFNFSNGDDKAPSYVKYELSDEQAGNVTDLWLTLDGVAVDTSFIDFSSINSVSQLASALNNIDGLDANYYDLGVDVIEIIWFIRQMST